VSELGPLTFEIWCPNCRHTLEAYLRDELPWGSDTVIRLRAECPSCLGEVVTYEGPQAGVHYWENEERKREKRHAKER